MGRGRKEVANRGTEKESAWRYGRALDRANFINVLFFLLSTSLLSSRSDYRRAREAHFGAWTSLYCSLSSPQHQVFFCTSILIEYLEVTSSESFTELALCNGPFLWSDDERHDPRSLPFIRSTCPSPGSVGTGTKRTDAETARRPTLSQKGELFRHWAAAANTRHNT